MELIRAMKAPSRTLAVVGCAAFLLTGCGGGNSGDELTIFPSNDSSAVLEDGQGPLVPVTPLSPDNFAFQIEPLFTDDQPEVIVNAIQSELGGAVAPMNTVSNVLANNTVSVMYDECGVANAFYSLDTREIFMCHELTLVAFDFFLEGGTSDAEIDTAFTFALQAMTHVMYHEMGHALDDLTGLNVGGNFESVADAIAVVLAVQTGQPRVAALGGSFTLASGESSLFDEHGSGIDRAGDILCWAVGGDAALAATLTELSTNFVEAGRDCVAEYNNQYSFVETLIPELRDIPTVNSLRSRTKQEPSSDMAELDRRMAAVLRGR